MTLLRLQLLVHASDKKKESMLYNIQHYLMRRNASQKRRKNVRAQSPVVAESESESDPPTTSTPLDTRQAVSIWQVVVIVIGAIALLGLLLLAVAYITVPYFISQKVIRCVPFVMEGKGKPQSPKQIGEPWAWFDKKSKARWYKWFTVYDLNQSDFRFQPSSPDEKFEDTTETLMYISCPMYSEQTVKDRFGLPLPHNGPTSKCDETRIQTYMETCKEHQLAWLTSRLDNSFAELVFFVHGAATPAKNYASHFGGRQQGGFKFKGYEPMDPAKRIFKDPVFVYPEFLGFGDLYAKKWCEQAPSWTQTETLNKRYIEPTASALKWSLEKMPNHQEVHLMGYSFGTTVLMCALRHLLENPDGTGISQPNVYRFLSKLKIHLVATLIDFTWIRKSIPVPTREQNWGDALLQDRLNVLVNLERICEERQKYAEQEKKAGRNFEIFTGPFIYIYYSKGDQFLKVRGLYGHTIDHFHIRLSSSGYSDYVEFIEVDSKENREFYFQEKEPYDHYNLNSCTFNF